MNRRLTATTALALTLAMVTAACGGGDGGGGNQSATTKSLGTITVYSGRNEDLVKPILKKFTIDTGIKVNLRTADSGAMASQILTEGAASPADVFLSQDAGALGAVTQAKLLRALPKSITDRVDPAFQARDRTWVGVSGRSRVVIYNPTLAPTPPKSIDEIVDSKWKAKIAFAPTNASWQSFVTALRIIRGEAAARSWLVKFKANNPTPFANNLQVRDAVDGGQAAIGLANHYYLYEKIAKVGADVVTAKNQFFTGGDVGGLINVAGVGVLASTKHKALAERLVDYLLSTKAQTYFASETFEYPLVASVKASTNLPPLATLDPPDIDLSNLSSIDKTQALLRDVGLLTA